MEFLGDFHPPIRSAGFCAKNGMKINAIIMARAPIMVKRYPILSMMILAAYKPRISPHKAPLERPVCQAAVS
jgi:hypothetical protein